MGTRRPRPRHAGTVGAEAGLGRGDARRPRLRGGVPRAGDPVLRSKYEVRGADGEIRKWKWLAYCPVCGKRLRVVFGKPWSIVKGVEVVDE